MEAQGGYIIPMAPGYADLEIYTGNPALAPYPAVSDYSRNKGFAGPANQKAAEAASQYIIVNMFAQAIQSGDAAGAVQQAEAQICSASTAGRRSRHDRLAASGCGGSQARSHVRRRATGRIVFAAEQPMSVITAESRAEPRSCPATSGQGALLGS